jgi:membrane protease YdiL (CAAX protease family)
MLRPRWRNLFQYNSLFALFLILLLGIPRFILVVDANASGNYTLIPFVFGVMTLLPFVFLSREGRDFIGITKPKNYYWLLYSFLLGVAVCVLAFLVAQVFFADSVSNWFVYISRSYAVSKVGFQGNDRHIYFAVYAVIGMTFSPVGEELFYRGLVHGGLAGKFGEATASTLDSLAFALTHLAHFGIIYTLSGWQFLFLPALLWVLCMFVASKVFFYSKQRTGSVWGAVLSHAGFNLAMMYFIFYWIFV